jgi:hypothetical protein
LLKEERVYGAVRNNFSSLALSKAKLVNCLYVLASSDHIEKDYVEELFIVKQLATELLSFRVFLSR